MTAEQFDAFWQRTYPGTVPLSYRLRDAYPTRWLRIHSLPDSKRYPSRKDEWETLLARQNRVLADVLELEERVMLVTGEYEFDSLHTTPSLEWQFSADECLAHLSFTLLTPIDLAKLPPDPRAVGEYKPGDVYRLVMTEVQWQPHAWDPILKAIAEDELRAFFVSIAHECLIAPYDGGIDFIFKNQRTRDHYRMKYHAWLSTREDGL